MKKKKTAIFICYIMIVLFTLWTIIPIILMVSQSIKPNSAMFSDPPTFFYSPTSIHFEKIFKDNAIISNMINSIKVAFFTMLLCITMGSMCGYALEKINAKIMSIIAIFIVLTRVVPVGALMMPIYLLMSKMGLTSSSLGVIFAHTVLNLPFAVLLLQGFFREIPEELEQAALVDGCNKFQMFQKIYIPLSAPGIATTSVIVLLNSWNEFMYALVLTSRATRTLPIGISSFMGSVSIDWGASSAAATVAIIPIIFFGFFIQKYFVRGIMNGSIKG